LLGKWGQIPVQRWLFESQQASTSTSIGAAYVYADAEGGLPEWAVLGSYDNGSASGTGRSEYIWLPVEGGGAIPVGLYRNGNLYAIHADHLGTPRLMTDGTNQVVWQWPYSAFGNNRPTGVLEVTTNPYHATTIDPEMLKATPPAVSLDLRFPGQMVDGETGTFYNYHRSYLAGQGRYTQSDPIGLDGGLNRYGYVGGNPLSDVDSLGLCGLNQGSCMSFGSNPLKKHPFYHEYETLMVICKLSANCTREAVFSRLKEFPTPASPKKGGVNTCDVSDIAGQKVSHVVDDANFALFNITQFSHMFDPGYVYRNVFVDGNGNVVLRTYGEGTGDFKGFNNFFGNFGWAVVDSRIQKPFR
jgi:RHS repeat-associated protein